MINYLGSRTVGDCMPFVAGLHAQLLADLQARLAAQLALVASIQLNPGSFTIQGSLDFAFGLVASIQAQIALGIVLPSISLQLDAAFAFIAALEVQIQVLLQIEFGTAGIHAYTYEGPVANFGGELAAVTAGGFPGGASTDHANALILATTVPAAWAALAALLRTT